MSRAGCSVAAAILASLAMGSIHAFSVLGVAMETRFDADRAAISAIYSLALVCLTASVLVSPLLYARFRPLVLLVAAFAVSLGGIAISREATAIWQVYAGYGLVFGAANGVAYGLALALGAAAAPGRKGLVMSVVTAAYAMGAALAAQLIGWGVRSGGTAVGFAALWWWLVLPGAAALVLLAVGRTRLPAPPTRVQSGAGAATALLWFAYGAAVFAGLMAIAHAAGIAQAEGGNARSLATATMLIALGNAAGGFVSAALADRWPVVRLLAVLPLACVAGLLVLALAPGLDAVLLGLTLVGFGYGATIAAYPPSIARIVGLARYPVVYGRVFTAWGLAGLIAPWLAGWLYLGGGGYRAALLLACALALTSIASVLLARGRLGELPAGAGGG